MNNELSIRVDIAMILTALAPVFVILVTAWVQERRRDVERIEDREQLNDIHVLVNDQMTREKVARLGDLRAQKIMLERLMGDDMADSDLEILIEMERRIEQLAKEIEKRNQLARSI